MQNVSQEFLDLAQGDMIPLAVAVRISFDKEFDDDINFFTIESSEIGGGDFIKPESSDVVQQWDKYVYQDFSDRIIEVSWEREVEVYSSVTLAMADIVLDNSDDYFTLGSNSPIEPNILPKRPIRIYAGYGDELIPVFIGLTDKMPIIDESNKTVTFHCIDFMYSLFNKPLNQSVMYIDQRVDQVLDSLFQLAGLSSTQIELDEGLTTIPFAYFPNGTKFLSALYKLMEAEGGRLYMDEDGIIRFKNRQNYSSTPVYEFNAYDHIYDIKTKNADDIINVVEIRGNIRRVQAKQKFGTLPSARGIAPGASESIWIEFSDPVTSVDAPVYIDDALTSFFAVNTAADGTGTANDTDIELTSTSQFATSYKMVFTNNGASILYITQLELYATPATVVEEVYARDESEDSVTKYEERLLPIDNDFFQSQTDAESRATLILGDFSEFGEINQLDVKGNIALQLDDPVTVDVFDRRGDYKITKIRNKITTPANLIQLLTVKNFEPKSYFTIGVSEIGGEDSIYP